MKMLIGVVCAFALSVSYVLAGVAPERDPSERAGSRLGERALWQLMTSCLPRLLEPEVAPGRNFERAASADESALLGARSGAVWRHRDDGLLMIEFHDMPACRIVVPGLSSMDLAFAAKQSFAYQFEGFLRTDIAFGEDGDYAARYELSHPKGGAIVLDLSTRVSGAGKTVGILSVTIEE